MKRMKLNLFPKASQLCVLGIVLLVLPTLLGCNSIKGSGVDKTENRTLGEFSSIEASGEYSIQIVCGQTREFEITGDDNLVPLIKTEVTNSNLKIFSDQSISPKNTIQIKISTETLNKVSLSGANKVTISGVKEETFVSEMNGAGKVEIFGESKSAKLILNGTGDLVAKDLKANSVTIKVNGVGDALVYATEELIASVNGVGNIDYLGDPKTVKPIINGVGKINKR